MRGRSAALRRSVFVIGVFALALLLTAAFLFRIDARDRQPDPPTRWESSSPPKRAIRCSTPSRTGSAGSPVVRSRAEIALYIYAREIEAKLAAPPPRRGAAGSTALASDIDAGRVDAARLVELPRYDRVEGGHRIPSPTAALSDQSFFAPPGANESRVRDDVARLRSIVPTVRWLYEENPELARFFAALSDTALYVQYPGSGSSHPATIRPSAAGTGRPSPATASRSPRPTATRPRSNW